jgi:heme-degrading monooxygenase HmoA
MLTRKMTCTLKLDKKEEFLEAARRLRSAYQGQTGFVDLLTFISDDRPDHALVVAVWRAKSDSQEFYKTRAPLLDLKPFLEEDQIEHYYLETSSVFQMGSGKAA